MIKIDDSRVIGFGVKGSKIIVESNGHVEPLNFYTHPNAPSFFLVYTRQLLRVRAPVRGKK
jgi:hypothetical protein